jgi:hypothetical protein
MMTARPIRSGNGAGFWGDNLGSPFLHALEVLSPEYLAEPTLAILAHLTPSSARR